MTSSDTNRLKVLLLTEGTYPYFMGGVSTWCHILVSGLPQVDFTLMSLVDEKQTKQHFKLPPNVVEFRPVNVWGTRGAIEHEESLSLRAILNRKRGISSHELQPFIRAWRTFLGGLFEDNATPIQLSQSVHQMYRFFLQYDFDTVMRHRQVWDCFVEIAQSAFPRLAEEYGYKDATFTLADIIQSLSWLQHMFIPISRPLPKVDIAHAAMVGMCTLVAITAKLEHGAAFLLTEHGIYLRETYLAEAKSSNSLFVKIVHLLFAQRMTEMSCTLADQISPCCDYNQRWERQLGATESQLKTIYYGVDTVAFTPEWKPMGKPPIVVWAGRINPLKDLTTLIEAAAQVLKARPEVQFHLYGTPPVGDESYYKSLIDLRQRLNVEKSVIFQGYTAKTADAFNQGDLAILSSISEAFPFVIVEAMLCGKPTVATGVGGVPEQIADCGIVVEPRNASQMAQAILNLLNNPEVCRTLGEKARAKAEHEYNLDKSNSIYLTSYQELAKRLAVTEPSRTRRTIARQYATSLNPVTVA